MFLENYANWIVSCSSDKTVKVFNFVSKELIKTFYGHKDTVYNLLYKKLENIELLVSVS